MKVGILCGLFLVLGIIIGMAIQSAAAFTDTDFVTLQKQVISLNTRLTNLEAAVQNSNGLVTVKGTSISLDASNITIRATGTLALKGTKITNN